MKNRTSPALQLGRVREGVLASKPGFENNGAFVVKGPKGRWLHIIASDKGGWDHVSVSLQTPVRSGKEWETPTWEEMCWAKDQFWDHDEWVLQYHPAQDDYINVHWGTLHLWAPQDEDIPVPPRELV